MDDLHRSCLPSVREYPKNRLFSLDVLRGLDMILLTVIGPLVCAAQGGWHCFPAGFVRQFYHGWQGFTLWDVVMPLFIFMCGAAMPFALTERLKKGPAVFWKHVLGRVLLLWCLGGLVQGQWMTLDPFRVTPFSNTLQSIAVGYLAVAVVLSSGSKVLTVIVPVVLVFGYALLLGACGDYSQHGNIAFKVDQYILRAVLPASSCWIVKPSYYTWFLTSAMFAAMTFAGYFATTLLRLPKSDWGKTGFVSIYGLVLLAIGFISEIWVPCIKPIFTISFTAQAMGWCVLSLAVLYVVTDIWKCRFGMTVILFFGQMSLAAYFTSHFFKPVLNSFAHLAADGVLTCLPSSASPFVLCMMEIVGMVLIMIGWRKIKQ